MAGVFRNALKGDHDMRLITASDLAKRSNSELAALFRDVSQTLALSEPSSSERRNALATLENIDRERAARLAARAAEP
jgi:hypothetical protein